MAQRKLKDSDIASWITVKGEHVPVKEGQTKAQAVKQNSKAGSKSNNTNKKKAKYDKLSTVKKKKK